VLLVKFRVTAKNVGLIDDHWKHMSTMDRPANVVISISPKEIAFKSRLNVPGPGHYHFEKPNVSPIVLIEAG